MNKGYEFYFKIGSDVLTFPITPSEMTIKVGSNNKVITLINEGEINILKSPSLAEVEFTARFPMRKYPYSREVSDFQVYFNMLEDIKVNKKSFRFIVARSTPGGKRTWDTNMLMVLEDFELEENADEGDDVLITFNLKQYKNYGVKLLNTSGIATSTSTSTTTRSTESKTASTNTSYTVKTGDTLWSIAKKFYGDASKYTTIYNANKTAIEADAKAHGKSSSSNGHWLWEGITLTIPSL